MYIRATLASRSSGLRRRANDVLLSTGTTADSRLLGNLYQVPPDVDAPPEPRRIREHLFDNVWFQYEG